MFKKRLKGLLAMVLAGSIATTALPLSASAVISGDISVVNANNTDEPNIEGVLTDYSQYLTANNLWAYYAGTTVSGGGNYLGATTGNSLREKLTELNSKTKSDGYPDTHKVSLRYSHDVIFIDSVPVVNGNYDDRKRVSITDFSEEAQTDVATIAKTLGLVTPLQSVSSWTAYYGYTNGVGDILGRSLDGTYYTISGTPKITQEIIKGLYSGNDSMESYLKYGAVFIVPEISDKTFNLPVLNTILEPEMNGSTPKTVSITRESSGNIDGYLEDFYLCHIDRTNNTVTNNTVKISNDPMSTKDEVWRNLGGFISGITNYDESNLCLVRNVTARVYGRGREDEVFTTKDFITGNIAGNSALKYLYVDAPAKSIWRVVANGSDKCFFATKDKIGDAINSCLTYKPNASEIAFTEYPFIYVTGTTPTAGGSIASENKCVAETLNDDSLKTISDLLVKLAEEIPPASGKKYDVNGWELWSADTDCGTLVNLEKTNFNTRGVTGVTADMFNKAGSKYPVIYFPQVNATSSGGSSSRPTTPAYDPDKPTIDGVEKSWSDVARDIGKMTEGENKMIYLGGDKTIPADVIKAIKDSKAVITFRISTAFSWTVDGSTLTDGDIHDYDFSIEVITATGVEILRGDVGVGFKIGDISDGATLNINFKKEHAQKFANLYKKVDGELVFVDNVKIDENGSAIGLKVSESGEYVVMLGKFSDRSGDMDNDGILNAKDSLTVLKDFLGIESGTNPVVSDVNKDGAINSKDALEILKMFLGLE